MRQESVMINDTTIAASPKAIGAPVGGYGSASDKGNQA